jgi:hypothetical protein
MRGLGAEGRSRTGTGVAPQQFLRLSRLPIPPLRLERAKSKLAGGDERIRTAE